MFSTSMMASSTTSPSAITRPGEDHRVDRPATVVQHERRGDQRQRDGGAADHRGAPVEEKHHQDDDDQHAADAGATGSGCRSDISMNVAGRKMVGSTSTSSSPGAAPRARARRPRVTSSVLPPGCFSTISSRPGPSLMMASPIGGGKPSVTSATSPSAAAHVRWKPTGDLAQLRRVLRPAARCDDRQPLVGSIEEPAGADGRRVSRGGRSPRRA